MRIAIANWSRNRVGGVESYLETVLPTLRARGHELAFLCERVSDERAAQIRLPAGVVCWESDRLGEEAAVDALTQWQPDVLYAHGMRSPALEERAMSVAPTLFFAHYYYGVCISGLKSHAFPATAACGKPFGAACLLHFFPRRCGGINPVRMWRDYTVQSRRLRLLSRCAALAVASEHMAREYRQHGLHSEVLPLFVDKALPDIATEPPALGAGEPVRLIFLGRMEASKGGDILLDCLPLVADRMQRSVVCHFGGEGRLLAKWQRRASHLSKRRRDVEIIFYGWLEPAQRDALLAQSHLLAVPSLWPEPFGLVGIEAGARGLPAVAFDVGGVRQWLTPGLNGGLAPGNPPTAAGLAEAIVQALTDPRHYAALRRGAREAASSFSLEKHVAKLEGLLDGISRRGALDRI